MPEGVNPNFWNPDPLAVTRLNHAAELAHIERQFDDPEYLVRLRELEQAAWAPRPLAVKAVRP